MKFRCLDDDTPLTYKKIIAGIPKDITCPNCKREYQFWELISEIFDRQNLEIEEAKNRIKQLEER